MLNKGIVKAFTLLEMLVAIMIFAVLSLMAGQIFKAILNNNQVVQSKATSISDIQKALNLLEQDISQAVIRPAADIATINLTDFAVVNGIKQPAYELEVVRNNWPNPNALLARSSLERVRYRLNHNTLQRLSYLSVDADNSQVRVIDLLKEVSQFQLRFWSANSWQTGWYASATLPEAIEITLVMARYGTLQRVILVGSAGSL